MNTDFDLIIVGARVAGSILATLLGRKGYRVLLLDRAQFPSDTLSTHFFRVYTLKALGTIDIRAQVESVAPRLVSNFNAIDGHVFSEPVEGPDGPSYYLCVRRITLDDMMVRRVQKERRVTFHQRATVDDLIWENGQVRALRWHQGEERYEATARAVVGADGIHSIVAKKLQPPAEHEEPVRRLMYYAYYAGIEPQSGPAAEFHFRGDRLVYAFPTDGNLTLLAASVPIIEFDEFRRDPEKNLTAELEAMPELAPRLRKAQRASPVMGTGSIPGYRRVPYGPGWALVGDAGMIMDPWSGQGIDQASTHSTILADALDSYLSSRESWDDALSGYHKRRNEFSVKTYERTCQFARDLRQLTQPALKKRGLT